jgi:cellobiose-specific phosphotransferase system component IIA
MLTRKADPRPRQLASYEFHIENAIGSLGDAISRIVRGLELLDLDKIAEAREKVESAERSLLRAIERRGK